RGSPIHAASSVSLFTPRLPPPSTPENVLTNAGPQFHQHVVAAQLGKQLEQAAHRGARASLPVVQQAARGVGMRLQPPDLQVLEVHLLRQPSPVRSHLRPHDMEGVGGADSAPEPPSAMAGRRGASALSSRLVGLCFLLPIKPPRPPGPAPPVSLSEKRHPALQSGAQQMCGGGGRPVSALRISGDGGCGAWEPAF
uniref:Uncharacterized protein n=1 Tax=Sus scrofa TaxID=9823 RepID=A0A8D1Q761_PIG